MFKTVPSLQARLRWHHEHSEKGEPSDFELTQHASLISWQRRCTAM